jgi:hypothetical protein
MSDRKTRDVIRVLDEQLNKLLLRMRNTDNFHEYDLKNDTWVFADWVLRDVLLLVEMVGAAEAELFLQDVLCSDSDSPFLPFVSWPHFQDAFRGVLKP